MVVEKGVVSGVMEVVVGSLVEVARAWRPHCGSDPGEARGYGVLLLLVKFYFKYQLHMDRQTDKPSYREASTHRKITLVLICW